MWCSLSSDSLCKQFFQVTPIHCKRHVRMTSQYFKDMKEVSTILFFVCIALHYKHYAVSFLYTLYTDLYTDLFILHCFTVFGFSFSGPSRLLCLPGMLHDWSTWTADAPRGSGGLEPESLVLKSVESVLS